MTWDGGQTTFERVLAKDPNRRKSRSGSRARINRSDSKNKRNPSPTRSSSPNSDVEFVLYVEGARDREILECWARRLEPALARCIEHNTVILGGRRPARALADYRRRGGLAAGLSGLVVLDRDDHEDEVIGSAMAEVVQASDAGGVEGAAIGMNAAMLSPEETEAGLEIFVWSLRHIESYLLVPAAIRRMLRLPADDRRVERFIENSWIENSGAMTASSSNLLHAKRMLGAGGMLSQAVGVELRAGEIARSMRLEDLHADVRKLFARIGTLSGVSVEATSGPEVFVRP